MRWMWIDAITEYEPDKRLVAVKNVSLAEEHLHDHFSATETHPALPLMPNSLIIEGMAQTVSDQAQGVSTTILNADSEHAPSGLTAPDAQDVVDHMNQMGRGNTVDMSDYRGEPNHDDNVDKFGKPSKLDGLRGDGT